MKQVTAEILVTGRVQGVGYRYFCQNEANKLHLSGWVKNEIDGSVKSIVQGEKEIIESYCKKLKQGPPLSHVDKLTCNFLIQSQEYKSFEIRY